MEASQKLAWDLFNDPYLEKYFGSNSSQRFDEMRLMLNKIFNSGLNSLASISSMNVQTKSATY